MTQIIKDEAYWKQYRKDWYAKKKQDPKWVEKNRTAAREYKRKQMANPEARKRVNENWIKRNNKQLEHDPEFSELRLAQRRDRYHEERSTEIGRMSAQLKHRCKKYGITPDQYLQMVERQNDLCAICNQPEKRKYKGKTMLLSIDHCHKTGNVRGLLCDACNTAIGRVNDSIELLENSIAYLKKYARGSSNGT